MWVADQRFGIRRALSSDRTNSVATRIRTGRGARVRPMTVTAGPAASTVGASAAPTSAYVSGAGIARDFLSRLVGGLAGRFLAEILHQAGLVMGAETPQRRPLQAPLGAAQQPLQG